jgi:hypothetical protein
MKGLEILLLTSTLLAAPAVLAQAPCSVFSKSDAESILGESVVQRANSTDNCWYVQNGFAGGTGPIFRICVPRNWLREGRGVIFPRFSALCHGSANR